MTSSHSIARVGILSTLLALTVVPRADAALIQIDFATVVNQSTFINTPFSGGFIYDDLGTGNCQAAPDPLTACGQTQVTPMLDLWLTFGTQRFGLADLDSLTPRVALPIGSNGWGPLSVNVRPSRLPAGLTALSLGPGAAVFTVLQFADGGIYLDQCPSSTCSFTVTTPPPASIPGASTFSLLAVGLGLLARHQRKRLVT